MPKPSPTKAGPKGSPKSPKGSTVGPGSKGPVSESVSSPKPEPIPAAESTAEPKPETRGVSGIAPGKNKAAPAGGSGDRLSIPVGKSGAVDLDGMQSRTREKFDRVIDATPGYARTEVALPEISDSALAYFWTLCGQLEVMVMSLRFGDDARIFSMQPSEIQALIGPSRAVAKKHLGKAGKWADEISLLLVLGGIHAQKLHALATLQRQRAASASPDRVNGATPVGDDSPKPEPKPSAEGSTVTVPLEENADGSDA